MGVYEDLLRRKKIIEDEQGNVTVNAVVNKSVRDKLTDNTIQTYQKDEESNRNAIAQMSNALKNAAKDTIWERMQSIISNKPTSSSNFMENFRTNLIQNTVNKDNNKNENIYDNSITNDAKNTFKNLILGGKQGAMQMLKGIETQTEANRDYKNKKEVQFYNSRNVSEMVKAQAKSESNDILNNMIKKKINNNSSNTADYGIGNIDLNNRPVYKNEDGSISTVRSMSFWDDDEQKEILVPTIAFDKDGKAISLTDDEAIDRYYKTGEYLGKFDNYKEADKYAEKLHESQEKIYTNNSDNTIINKSALLKLNDESVKNELDKYKNSISDGKIDTNLTRNYLQNNIDKTTEEIQENTDKINNKTVKKANEQIVPAIGQMGAGMVASAVNPAVGMMYFTESATGGYYDDAKQRGMNDDEARKYSTIMGAMEGATEQIGIENLSKAGKGIKALVKGTGKETIKQGAKEITQSSLKTVLKDYGISIADNIMQEAIIDPIQELTAQTIAGKDKAQWEGIGQKMLQDGINGGLVSAILGGANLGIQSCTGVVEKLHSNQKITGQEIQNAVKDANQQLDTSKIMMDSVEQQVNKYKDYYTGKNLDSNTQDILNQAQNIINDNSTQNLQQNNTQNQINQQMQQVTPVQNENVSNLDINANNLKENVLNEINNTKQQNDILNNKELPMQSYRYEKSDNVKINNLRQDANKYFNNSEKARNYVNMLEKIITDKNIDIRLDANLKTVDGRIANGSYSNGVITINPNSTRTGEFIAIHELTHAIGTKDMLDMVNRYRESNAEFNSAVENLLQSYNTTELTEEALSDVSAQLFGNQEFINNLSQTNPNLFKRIYNEIKYLWHQFRGYKNQDQFIEDLKYKWEQAYKNNDALNNTTNFSIAGKKSLENIKDNSLLHSRGINSYNNAINLAKQKINNEQIRQKTGWFQDKNGDWKYEFSDKDMALKNIKIQNDKTYKLGDILEHDTLFTLYPEVENYKVEINDNIKANASFDRKNNTITINSKLIKNNKSLEGTLIHEIQHAIQNIENFERGTSTKGSKLKYYNSLGEIEATETKGRFLKEKYQNKNMFSIAPESSKANPQHKDLNKYLKNRNLLDKVKDSMYNYFNKRGVNNYDVSEEIVEKDRTQNNSLVDERKRLESENNSGSFNLQKNRFDVSGNENLVNAKTLFYRTRDDGQYYVQATDGSGKITYDGVFYREKQLARSLGEEIAKKIVNTSKSTNNEIYLQSDNIKSETDYMMAHRPTETGAYASNITKGTGEWDSLMPEDVYEHPEWYFDMNQEYSKESFKVLKQIKNNPNAEITIYRATTGNKINKGDWVTLSKKYAEYHNNSQFKGKGNIIELKVKAKDVQYAGDDINEFGYFPQIDIQTTDNQGRILSKEQQEYFKNSKVKDDNGQLITVYHGTNNAGFTQFNRNINYFTDNKNVAKTYTGKNEIYEGYINITNPITIDANEEIWSKIDINNILIDGIDDVKSFLDTYGASTWKESGTTRTSTADLVSAIYDAIDEGELNADGIIINNIYDEGAYSNSVGKQLGTDFVTFNSNQFKNIDNINPTDNPDIRFSQNNETWQQYIDKNYKPTGTRTNLKEVRLPTKEDVKTKLNLPTKENVNTQGESINWNEIERPERKIRKHYKSIIESSNTTKEAKSIAKKLMGTDTYVPETNKSQLAQADTRINNSSPETELKSLMNRATTGGKIEAVDIAVGERLIQYYSKIGDKANLQEAIQATAMAGTNAGRTVQALSMLNHQTPEGQATWIQRSVDKMNNELAKKKGGTITKDSNGNVKIINKQGKDITDKVQLFDLTPEMIEKVVDSKDKQTMYENIDSVYEELGNQVPKSTIEKIDSWRYFSMLANPRTHIRNMVGNVAMGKTQRIKDKLAGGIEGVVSKFNPEMERTKTLMPANSKTKEFAKSDVLNPDVQSMMELNENKYNPQSRLQNARRTFKSDIFEKSLGRLFDWNDKALEAEDALGLKSAYKKALSDYLTANKIDTDKITDAQLSKARNYAVQQAKEATFHQANSIATAINQFSRKNKLTKGATDAILPFVKTPMNVAKAGLEYNPLGLLKTITSDTVKLRKGNISVNKYIDNLSKGLTGTGIAVLGYALADAGILKASGSDDDKKENYDEAIGKQSYSLQIGDKTYSLDWLAPVGIPLFTGAEAFSLKQSKQDEKSSLSTEDNKETNKLINSLENWANGMANAISPMSEMSMISGLTSALTSYQQDSTQMIGSMLTNAGKSYVNQFVPTLLGQTAKTMDKYERSTTSTKTGLLPKAIDQTKLQMMSKIPGLRQKLPTKTDIWGNELKQSPNIRERTFNNFINPATVKNIGNSKVDSEIDNLYNKSGNTNILPTKIDKTYTINGQKYRMTDEEYAKYQKQYGQTSYKLIENLINAKDYKNLSAEQKETAIENIYSYAKECGKLNYAKTSKTEIKPSTLYTTMEDLKKNGGNQSQYLEYIAKTKDITGENSSKQKIGILADSNYSDKTKEIIYKNTEGSKDKKVIVVDKLGLPVNEYLKYKTQKFVSDKDENGDAISGSKKEKVYEYLNNIPDEQLSQDYKKIICKIEGTTNYDVNVIDIVNNKENLTTNERKEILTNLGFKIYENGKIKLSSKIPLARYVK